MARISGSLAAFNIAISAPFKKLQKSQATILFVKNLHSCGFFYFKKMRGWLSSLRAVIAHVK
jgi:hypothetical protein